MALMDVWDMDSNLEARNAMRAMARIRGGLHEKAELLSSAMKPGAPKPTFHELRPTIRGAGPISSAVGRRETMKTHEGSPKSSWESPVCSHPRLVEVAILGW